MATRAGGAQEGDAPHGTLPFSVAEFKDRLARARTRMRTQSLEVIVLTSPENILYLSGYRTTGYYIFQALVVPVAGEPQFVARKLEMTNVPALSWLKSGIPVEDTEHPLDALVRALELCGGEAPVIGYEESGYFLPPGILDSLRARMPRARLVPASGVVEQCRVVKSPAEIEYIRKAAAAAVAGLRAGIAEIRPGRTENDVAAAVYAGLLKAGSEYPTGQPYVVTGPRSALAHATYDGHRIRSGELVYFEVGGSVKRYTGAIMRTVSVGRPTAEVKKMAGVVIRALEAILETIKPGVTSGAVDAAGRSVVEAAGLGKYWLHRTGYSIGVAFPPGWGEGHIMDLKAGDPRELAAGMTFHLVPLLLIPGIGGIGFSASVLVTKTGCEVLSKFPRRLVTV